MNEISVVIASTPISWLFNYLSGFAFGKCEDHGRENQGKTLREGTLPRNGIEQRGIEKHRTERVSVATAPGCISTRE